MQLERLLQNRIEVLGFDFFAFLVQYPPPSFWFSTYPESWVRRYESENYQDTEWTQSLFSEAGDLWERVNAEKLNSVFSCSTMAPNRTISILSIVSKLHSKTRHLRV